MSGITLGLPASAGHRSPSALGVRVGGSHRRRGGSRDINTSHTGVMGHSCCSAAGRRIGILLRPARSSQSSWVLGPAAGPPILRPRPGAAPLRSPGGLGRASRPLWPRTTSSPSPGAAAPDRAHHPEHIILGTCAGRSSRTCASFPATSSWTRAPGHPGHPLWHPRWLLQWQQDDANQLRARAAVVRELLPLLRALPFAFFCCSFSVFFRHVSRFRRVFFALS